MADTETTEPGCGQLGAGLKQRHITMISIAGVIGAGIFIGSGVAINTAGPGVLLSYLLAGTLVVLVMRMLGEMAIAQPDSGSFSTYAERAIGPWAGFSIGWLYWWFWVIVIPVEATAAALVLHDWLPDVPRWVFALLVTLLLTGTNLVSVGNYGEFEFWFALIKVVAIVAFIGVGVLAILGWLPTSDVSGVSRLWENGGFLPEGLGAVLTAMLITMFTFMGTEIVTIAAAESKDPGTGIRRAVNSVIWRISLFYVGSIFIVVSLVPWQSGQLAAPGSFQAALNAMGLADYKWVLDLVVLTAVASCLNSALYTASRMAFSLSRRGEAPAAWSRVRDNGVPTWAILASTAVGFLAVIGNYVLPSKIFSYLLATSGAIALLVYLVIAVSQLRMRRQIDDSELELRMWGYPVLTWVVIVFIIGTLAYMAFQPDYDQLLWLTMGLTAVVVGAGVLRQLRSGDRQTTDA